MLPNEMQARFGNAGLQWQDKRPKISLEENSREYKATNHNKKDVICYHIDSGLIKDIPEQKACDYGLGVPIDDRFILIEFKGSNLDHAVQQIEATIEFLKSKLIDFKVDARIILSRNRAIALESSGSAKLKLRLRHYKNGNLKTSTSRFEEDL